MFYVTFTMHLFIEVHFTDITLHCCSWKAVPICMLKGHVSYPVDLSVLQQKLHYLCVTSSGCKVQRGAELAIQQVWITVTFLQ